MILSELQALVGSLTNDPNHDRYLLSDINMELNNTQSQWNSEIKIVTKTFNLVTINGVSEYSLLGFGSTIISFPRVTHKGIDLKKRSKSYFDLYTSGDWTQQIGTPTDFYVVATDLEAFSLHLYPIPQGNDAGNNLVVEAVIETGSMSSSTDLPYTGAGLSISVRPYDFYLAYSAAARLLARDPSAENQARAGEYLKIASAGKELLINVFKQLEANEPLRLMGGRNWVF